MVIPAHFDETSGQAGQARDPRRTLRFGSRGVTASGDEARVLVHNISASGLLLESEAALAPEVRIDIDLPQAGLTPARVIWASGNFFGCQFDAPVSTAVLSAAQLRGDGPGGRDEAEAPARQGAIGNEAFGARLRRMRKERGLSLSQISEHLGVSKPTVWAWEQGRTRPVEGRIEALAQILGVPAERLFSHSVSLEADVVARAREQIAGVLGVAPDKIRITVEL